MIHIRYASRLFKLTTALISRKMSQETSKNGHKVYKVVLTGGPCGGKTTGQARLSTFFENLGWKVYRVPETNTVLMSGGVKWTELSEEAAYKYQENLLKTMMTMENSYFNLAENTPNNCLVICDRGTMDATAYMKPGQWERMKKENGWNEVDLRDSRYNQIIHMVSAAKGAEEFYTTEDHSVRYEGIEMARQLDDMTAQAWVGHPYYDVIDNSTEFEKKVMRMISAVCDRLRIDCKDRLALNSLKRKYLVARLPDDVVFPQHEDFAVVHDYLVTPSLKMQARIRRRGQNGNWTYTHTIRRPEINNQSVELKMQVSGRDYQILLAQKDEKHYTIYKKRRCFLYNNHYYQMDIYEKPCPNKCEGLILLETYTTHKGPLGKLPDFLEIKREVTNDPEYSMFNLSRRSPDEKENGSASSSEFHDERDMSKIQKVIANSPPAYYNNNLSGNKFNFEGMDQMYIKTVNGHANHTHIENGLVDEGEK